MDSKKCVWERLRNKHQRKKLVEMRWLDWEIKEYPNSYRVWNSILRIFATSRKSGVEILKNFFQFVFHFTSSVRLFVVLFVLLFVPFSISIFENNSQQQIRWRLRERESEWFWKWMRRKTKTERKRKFGKARYYCCCYYSKYIRIYTHN